MKIRQILAAVLVAAIGIATTGFVSSHYACNGKMRKACSSCKTPKSACCKIISEYSNVESIAKPLHKTATPALPSVYVRAERNCAIASLCITHLEAASQQRIPPSVLRI